jgi:hypothetical protein
METVLLWAPWIVLGCMGALLLIVNRSFGGETPGGWGVVASLWEEPETEEAGAGGGA